VKPPPWRLALGAQAVLTQGAWVGVRIMVGYRALELGADATLIGLAVACMAAPALPLALPAGRMADRFGGARVAATGMLTAAVGLVLLLVLPGLPVLFVAATVCGLGYLLVMIGHQTFVSAVAQGRADAAFGTLSAAASLGQLIAPPVITVMASGVGAATAIRPDATGGLIACLAFTLAALPLHVGVRRAERRRGLGLSRPPERASGSAGPGARSELLRAPGMWRALLVSGVVVVSLDMLFAFAPLWATERGVDANVLGLLLALRAAVAIVSRFGMSRLVERLGRERLLICCLVVAALAMVAMPLSGLAGAIVAMVALGVGLGIPQPVTMAWVVSLVAPQRAGQALGLRMVGNRLAQLVVPLTLSALLGFTGSIGMFLGTAAVLAGALPLVVRGRQAAD